MPDPCLYEYAVIRVVPRVEREEFLNVGVIMYCASSRFLEVKYWLQREKLAALAPEADAEEIELHLQALQRIAAGEGKAGPISKLPVAERFRWLTATRSTIVQTSRVHSGMCHQLDQELLRLFELLAV